MIRIAVLTLLAALLVCPAFATPRAGEFRVQAEGMKLENYAIGASEGTSFIALTGASGGASFTFTLPSGRYDIDARYLSEKAGQNTYAVTLNGTQVISWLGKDRDDRWHLLSEQAWHVPRNVAIATGTEVRIETLGATGSRGILDYLAFTPSSPTGSPLRTARVTVHPEEYPGAFRNPLKGFRAGFGKAHEYATLAKSYLRWNELERSEADGVARIREVCDAKWSGCEKQNLKLIPRVYLAWPRRESGWPVDLAEGDFTSATFKRRALALIAKLAEAWDHDPRVAFVEMGLIGEWGEMEWPDTTDEIKAAIAEQFAVSFRHKLVMIRWPNTYNDDLHNFGYYWDSWAHHDQRYYAYQLENVSPRWKTSVIGGEAAYGWGNYRIQPGASPDASLSDPVHREHVLDQIRRLHGNHMGWIASYDHANERVRAGAVPVQKALGYRFVVSEVVYPKRVDARKPFTVSFKVTNTGSSPFYYNWPVEVSLLDPQTRKPVWKDTFADLDLRTWLPGDRWDPPSKRYAVAPEINLATGSFILSDVPPGAYVLALAILDPAGMRPNARFAITNYYNGGRHPIGKIGVGRDLDSFSVADFDDLQGDDSLSYDGPTGR